ncbi:hypothetical protein J6590_046961 [Homalodisca vitripennis]|nr:hypothetical protein J6590_046961 [Homalodisca vitripennis]
MAQVIGIDNLKSQLRTVESSPAMDSRYLILLLVFACVIICEGNVIYKVKKYEGESDNFVPTKIDKRQIVQKIATNSDLTHKMAVILQKNLMDMLKSDGFQLLALLWNERNSFLE